MFFTAPQIDGKLQKKLQQALQQQRKYQQQGEYDAAKTAYQKVQEMKKQLENLKIKQLQIQTDQQLQHLDTKMKDQLETLTHIAEQKIQSISHQQQKKFAQLAIKNQKQLQERQSKLIQQTVESFQPSAYLLKLKKLQMQNLKKEEYILEFIKFLISQKSANQKEHNTWQQLRMKKIQSELQQIRVRQRKQIEDIRKNNDKKIQETKYHLVLQQKKLIKNYDQLKLETRSLMNQNVTFWKDVTKKGKKSVVFEQLMGKSAIFKDLSQSTLFLDKN